MSNKCTPRAKRSVFSCTYQLPENNTIDHSGGREFLLDIQFLKIQMPLTYVLWKVSVEGLDTYRGLQRTNQSLYPLIHISLLLRLNHNSRKGLGA